MRRKNRRKVLIKDKNESGGNTRRFLSIKGERKEPVSKVIICGSREREFRVRGKTDTTKGGYNTRPASAPPRI